MATLYFKGQIVGGGTQECTATDKFGFYGAAFNDAITVGQYQTTSHVENSSNVDQCTPTHLNNNKYTGPALMDINGGGSEDVANLLTTEATLDLHFNHGSSCSVVDCVLWADDGGTPDTDPPSGVTFQALEQGDAAWTGAGGSGNALELSDKGTPNTDHHWYVAMSASPSSIGVKTDFEINVTLTYY